MTSNSGFLDSLRRVAAVVLVYPSGLLCLRAGLRDRAAVRFAWVIRNRPTHFGAHVRLASLLFQRGSLAEGIRLLRQARWIDPLRFQRLLIPAELRAAVEGEGFPRAGSVQVGPLSRGTSGLRHPIGTEQASQGGMAPGRGGSLSREPEARIFRYRDFASREEYEHFRDLPPISEEEILAVDWNRLLSHLARIDSRETPPSGA